MKKFLFTFTLLTTLLIVMVIFPNHSLAISRAGLVSPTGGISMNAGSFGSNANTSVDATSTGKVFQLIGGILLYGAVAVAVIWGAVLGIRFITGTVETKATIKDNLVPYFVGLIVAFGAYGIWSAVINILQ